MNKLIIFALAFVAFCDAAQIHRNQFEQVKLNDLETLGFLKGQQTIGNYPRDQMTCMGDLCDSHELDKATCKNAGAHTGSDEWSCDTGSSDVQFSSWGFSCEIFPGTSAADRIIIKGSCSFNYELQAGGLFVKVQHTKVTLF